MHLFAQVYNYIYAEPSNPHVVQGNMIDACYGECELHVPAWNIVHVSTVAHPRSSNTAVLVKCSGYEDMNYGGYCGWINCGMSDCVVST